MGAPQEHAGSSEVLARMADLEGRLATLEGRIEELARELRTGRLVLTGGADEPRIVAEIRDRRAEIRLEQEDPEHRERSDLVLFADRGADGLGGGLGIQFWVSGEAVVEVNCWQRPGARWSTDVSGLDG